MLKATLDPLEYVRYSRPPSVWPNRKGGQELILAEIVAALTPYERVFIPFYCTGALSLALRQMGHKVIDHPRDPAAYRLDLPEADAIYFGTPTIVDNKNLFREVEDWNVEKERAVVRHLCKRATEKGYAMIVSGLGSGDISTSERLADMGGGEILCFKQFDGFCDWVLGRKLRELG